MARDGSHYFKRNDGIRALKIVRDGEFEPIAPGNVVGTDGAVTFRVYSEAAALMLVATETTADARDLVHPQGAP